MSRPTHQGVISRPGLPRRQALLAGSLARCGNQTVIGTPQAHSQDSWKAGGGGHVCSFLLGIWSCLEIAAGDSKPLWVNDPKNCSVEKNQTP